MRIVGMFEAKAQLAAPLDEVEGGAEILFTRRSKVIARLEPADDSHDRAKTRHAVEGLRLASQGLTLGDLAVIDLVHEGRC